MSSRVAVTLVFIAFGALAFGAVYPWAYVPLFAGCAALGGGLLLHRKRAQMIDLRLATTLAMLAVAVGLQLVPVSAGIIRRISPETDVILSRYAVGYPTVNRAHALSIAPSATMLALAAVCALALLFLGLARSFTLHDSRDLARGVTVLGVVMALAGIAQKAMWNGKIYGFWTPLQAGDSFGPFVNRNHFAGWMLMALPLAVGYFFGRLARGVRQVKPGWRPWVAWLSSADASETILVGFAALLMALALMLTMSRSGMLGLLAALVISGWFVARRQATASRRALVVGYLLFVAFAAAGWTGFDRIAARFTESGASEIGGRLGIWGDTWRIARRFPAVGTGLNTFGVATIFYQTVDLQQHFAEAHNDYLQLMSDGGVLLCIPAALLILTFAWTVHRRFREVSAGSSDYWARVGAITGILAIALQEVSDFSLQMPGNALLFVVLMALAVRQSSTERMERVS